MSWDLATPFIIDLQVQAEDIDGFGHANNAAYVVWLERCAWRHSQRLGLDLTEYRRLDRAMAVARHEIDYLASAYEGDELQLATWIIDCDKRLRMTKKSNNQIYIITAQDSPNTMKEIGRLREIAFRAAGGGTCMSMDIY